MGGAGNDTLYGAAEREFLGGGTGSDALYAGAGDDRLQLDEWTSADQISGGDGNDWLTVGSADGRVTASVLGTISYSSGLGVESVWFDERANLSGTSGADTYDLRGFSTFYVHNLITLLGGNDRFLGGADGNSVSGGDGNDSLVAGSGGDALYGDAGDDTLLGGMRDDTLLGGAGRDYMVGGEGGDTYEIDSANDVVIETGTYGIDVLLVPYATYTVTGPFEGVGAASGNLKFHGIGSAMANMLVGGNGADLLEGRGGNDTLRGGIGHDKLIGGIGNDRYEETGTALTIVELAGGGNDTIVALGAVGQLFDNVENLWGGETAAYTGRGTATGNRISGYIFDDTLMGFGGNDTLDGMYGSNRLIGGAGDDTYLLSSSTDVEVEFAQGGHDRAILQAGVAACTISAGIEDLILTGTPIYVPIFGQTGTTGASGTGSRDDNRIIGSDGSDTLTGMGGDDSLFGGKGSDLIYGGDGSDSLQGAEGYDTLYGGDGADRLEGSNLGSATLYGGAGDDVYLVRNDWTYSSSNFFELAGEGIDTVLLVHGDLHLAPNFERLVVRDPSGRGHALAGNDEANTLIAGKGNDVLEGGLGNDTLTGGAGIDSFVFRNAPGADNADTVTGFYSQFETIYLGGFYSYLGGKTVPHQAVMYLADGVFKNLGHGHVDADDRIIYDPAKGELYYDADGSGAEQAQLIATFTGHNPVYETNFFVYL